MGKNNITLDACLCTFGSTPAPLMAGLEAQIKQGQLDCPINYLKKLYRLGRWRKLFIFFWRLELFCFYRRWGRLFRGMFVLASKFCALPSYAYSCPPGCVEPLQQTKTQEVEGQGEGGQGKPLKILLVEDNEIIQFLHKEMLIILDCEVDIAGTGHQALARSETQVYDVVLLDIGLPDISGIEVAQVLSAGKQLRSTRLIAITAHGPDCQAACLAAGIEQVAIKPIGLEGLRSLIYQTKN